MARADDRDLLDGLSDVERALRRLDAATEIARAVGGETRLERVLSLIVERGRGLVAARAMLILLREGEELVVAAASGQVHSAHPGTRALVGEDALGRVLRGRTALRLEGGEARDALGPPLSSGRARALLAVPLAFRETVLGVLVAVDQLGPSGRFDGDDEDLLGAFAANAAVAVATAQAVERERLRTSVRSVEAQRRRFARELHDQTLQGLGATRRLLSVALRAGDGERLREASEAAVTLLDGEIRSLREIIADLRPAALDELGLEPALRSLAERIEARSGIAIDLDVELPGADGDRIGAEHETVLYRLVQEALSNVERHSGAAEARVSIAREAGRLRLLVADDGRGFESSRAGEGFGLPGMRERVALLDGRLEIVSAPARGTRVIASLPLPP